MIESSYNYEFSNYEGAALIINGLTGTIIAKPHYSLTSPKLPEEIKGFLVNHGYIVDSLDYQRHSLLERNQSLKNDRRRVELTITMHKECNFRCTYCTQDFKNQKFGVPQQEALVEHLSPRLNEESSLVVHYYGGEPLLAWEDLHSLNQKLISLTDERHCQYRFFITTNGSLLTRDKVDYLRDMPINHIKITLDGPPHTHNARRKRAGDGKHTFDKIIANLEYAVGLIPVIVRINVDQTIVDEIPKLLDILEERFQSRKDLLSLDYNIVFDGDTGKLARDFSFKDLIKLQRLSLSRGFKLKLPPLAKYRHCKFNSSGSVLVDPSGEMYVCEAKDEYSLGSIPDQPKSSNGAQIIAADKSNLARIQKNFQNLKDHCSTCNLLPICGGGCSVLGGPNGTEPPCPPWKAHLQDYLSLHYESSTC